jgi:hypothetical protein
MRLLLHLGFDELNLKIQQISKELNLQEKEVKRRISQFLDMEEVKQLIFKFSPEEIKEILRKIKEKMLSQEYQKIGEIAEKIITKILSEKGFKNIYWRFGGADIEIEDVGRVECEDRGSKIYIEVKFTQSDRVRLSKSQGECAIEEKEKYFICVIEGNESLREKILNYFDVSYREQKEIEDMIIEHAYIIENIGKLINIFHHPEMESEVEPDIKGYWIKKPLWRKKQFKEWISTLKIS